MIPAAFDYQRPDTVDDAIGVLAENGDDAKVLAGGHSLIPLMRMRLAAPELIVDVGRLDELRGVVEDGDALQIGAMTTHRDVVNDELINAHCGVLAEVTSAVGDPQVRNRGTIGGALAHGDAAGDLPAVIAALDGELVVQGPNGGRTIAASDFFVDYLETTLADDEIVTAVRVPKLGSDWGWAYEKFNRVAQAWAIVGSCALVRRDNGSIAEARVGLTNMATVPVRATATESAVAGAEASIEAISDAAGAAADGTDAPSDLNADAAYRQHLARVLTRRALARAAGV